MSGSGASSRCVGVVGVGRPGGVGPTPEARIAGGERSTIPAFRPATRSVPSLTAGGYPRGRRPALGLRPSSRPGSAMNPVPPSESLDAIFKAYDIRGVYPDQIDETVARLVGNAFVGFTGADRVLVGPRRAAVVGAAGRGVRRRRAPRRRRRRRPRARVHRPRLLRRPAASTRRPRCSPPATTPRSTTASSCAAPARRRSARTPACASSRRWWPRVCSSGPRSRAGVERRDLLGAFVDARALVRRPRRAAPDAGRRRHRQRRRRPHRPRRVLRPARSSSASSSASSTARSRTTRPTRSSPRT